MGGVINNNAAENEESRKARVDSIISKFDGLLKLRPANEYYYDFVCGPWVVRTNNCMLNLNNAIVLVVRNFPIEATSDEIKKIMIEMVKESQEKIKHFQSLIIEVQTQMKDEYTRLT